MHKDLEKYLTQIEKQLSALPAEQRQNELREIRSHLEMMVEQNVARGDDFDEAVAKALKQSGAAKNVELHLVPIKRSNHILWWRVILASFTTLILPIVFIAFIGLFVMPKFVIPVRYQAWVNYGGIFTIMFVTGWSAEYIAPKKGVISVIITFFALSCAVYIFKLTPLFMSSHSHLNLTLEIIVTLIGVLSRRMIKEKILKPMLSIS